MIKNEISPATTDIYQDYLKAYRELHLVRQSVIRHEASKELKEEGCEEIGSCDISCRVYACSSSTAALRPGSNS